jgi:hypothetical protein
MRHALDAPIQIQKFDPAIPLAHVGLSPQLAQQIMSKNALPLA